jgi:hypothetical protein
VPTTPIAHPPPEKCAIKARPKEPNPPRVTPSEPISDEAADAERIEEGSSLSKLLRDDDPRVAPWPPPDDDPRGHSALPCKSDVVPGRLGRQFYFGISA